MAIEKKWLAITATPFTSNGTQFGVITIADTAGFKTKQLVVVAANTLTILQLQVKRVISNTQLIVGPVDNKVLPSDFTDLSAYTIALNASIAAPEQVKNNVPEKDHYSAVYEGDPTVADRVVNVDQYGRFYGPGNPYPITFDGTIAVGNVTVQDDDGDELEINPDGSINTNVAVPVLNPLIVNISVTLANTEQSFSFPNNTKKFLIRVRDGLSKMKVAYSPNGTNTDYLTVGMGCNYGEEINVSGQTLYYQLNKPNQIIELLYWVQP